MIESIKHVFNCKAGKIDDLVIAETKDAAVAKFAHLTTIQGKPVLVKDVTAEFLYTLKD